MTTGDETQSLAQLFGPDAARFHELLETEAKFHTVMDCLRKLKMPHGTCLPRERKACTHCAAAERLLKMQAEYKGPRVRLA